MTAEKAFTMAIELALACNEGCLNDDDMMLWCNQCIAKRILDLSVEVMP